MSIKTKLTKYFYTISSFTENRRFIAFNAHWGTIAYILSRWPYGPARWIACACALIIVIAKEFWFDLHFEIVPPQTLSSSTRDFAGYLFGICLAVIWP